MPSTASSKATAKVGIGVGGTGVGSAGGGAGGFIGGYGVAYLFGKVRGPEGLGAYIGAGLCLLLTLGAFALQVPILLALF